MDTVSLPAGSDFNRSGSTDSVFVVFKCEAGFNFIDEAAWSDFEFNKHLRLAYIRGESIRHFCNNGDEICGNVLLILSFEAESLVCELNKARQGGIAARSLILDADVVLESVTTVRRLSGCLVGEG